MPTTPITKVLDHLRRLLLMPEGAELTDGQLLECFLSRQEPAALEALVGRHGPMVWGVCRRILGKGHDAEDAFQATFLVLVLVRKAASVSPRSKVGSWLYGVARQTALKARATRARRKERERPVTSMPEPAVTDPELRSDLLALLDVEISRLPEHYRDAIVLCELRGQTVKQAARQLGCPEGTIASRLARGRALLAKRLTRRGLAVTGGALAAVLAPQASAAVPAPVLTSTLKAATVFAAGQGAAPGVLSGAITALTEGVIKAMFVNQLMKLSGLLLVVAALGALAGLIYRAQATEPPKAQQSGVRPQVSAEGGTQEKPAKEDVARLQGTWRLVGSEIDGVTLGEGRPELKGASLTFKGSSVVMTGKLIHSPRVMLKPEDVKAVGTFAVDTTKGPKVIVFTWKSNPWLTEEYFTQRSIYALAGDSLKICSCFPGQGTKGLLPTEFTAKAGSKRGLSTFRRDRPSGQRGEKKAREGAGEEKGGDTKQSAEEVRRKLQGAWKLATIEVDGLTAGEGRPELKGNRLVIERGSLTFFCTPDLGVFGDRAAGANEAAATFTLNAKRAPLVIVLTWKECPWNGKEDFMQEAICAVAGDTLTLCLGGKDGEVKAPTDFSAEAGSRRLLWTFKRVAGPGRPGEKHAAPHD